MERPPFGGVRFLEKDEPPMLSPGALRDRDLRREPGTSLA